MADAFLGASTFSASRLGNYGVFVNVPSLPLYVPASAKAILNDLVIDTIRMAMQDVAGSISEEAGTFADTGSLAQSWAGGTELVGSDATSGIYGRVFSDLPHAAPMDRGRRPGQPISRNGIDAIGLWAQRKLGLSAEEADKAKWAIAMTIKQQGIEGKYYVEAGLAQATPRVDLMFQTLSTTIGEALIGTKGSGGGRQRDARGRFTKR